MWKSFKDLQKNASNTFTMRAGTNSSMKRPLTSYKLNKSLSKTKRDMAYSNNAFGEQTGMSSTQRRSSPYIGSHVSSNHTMSKPDFNP